MKINDFSIEFQQKFDFDGKPYKFSKVDVDVDESITLSILGNFANQTPEYLGNVMCVVSDFLCFEGTSVCGYWFQQGEVVYMSTLCDKLNSLDSGTVCKFGFLQITIQAKMSIVGVVQNRLTPCAGTFYIFDFNDNPIDLNSK